MIRTNQLMKGSDRGNISSRVKRKSNGRKIRIARVTVLVIATRSSSEA